MINIVHCVTDEKFAKNIVTTFEFLADRCHSNYVYIESSKPKKLLYIKDNASIEHLKIDELMSRLQQGKYDVLFLHSLRSMPLNHIPLIPLQVKVVWLAWGFDIYYRVGARPLVEVPNVYLPETKKLMKPTMSEIFTKTGKRLYKMFIQDRIMRKAVARVDFFSGVFPEEFDMMRCNSFFRARPIEYRYASPSSNISLDLLNTEEPVMGMNILVGNSGDPSNNHADIFKKMSKVELGDRKIIVPLNYGGTSCYRQRVKELGKHLWGNRFITIESFMPYENYKSFISSCGFRIFGHERQQAIGNIRVAFRSGCKVFLSKSSIIYRHQAALGLKIYTIQDDIENGGLLTLPTDKETRDNRMIAVIDDLSSKQIERLNNMTDIIFSEIK